MTIPEKADRLEATCRRLIDMTPLTMADVSRQMGDSYSNVHNMLRVGFTIPSNKLDRFRRMLAAILYLITKP